MNEKLKKELEAAIDQCAKNAKAAKSALDAMQYAQAAVNLSNVICGLIEAARAK